MRIVVTGSIGCGKSTVVEVLQRELPDYEVFDFDRVVHDLYEDNHIKTQLESVFGTSERHTISDIVHHNTDKMQLLGTIFNTELVRRLTEACDRENVILDVPLWFEICDLVGASTLNADEVVCITCEPQLQRNRIRARNGFSDEKIDAILSKQLPQELKASRSSFVIDNSGSVDELKQQVVSFVTTKVH